MTTKISMEQKSIRQIKTEILANYCTRPQNDRINALIDEIAANRYLLLKLHSEIQKLNSND